MGKNSPSWLRHLRKALVNKKVAKALVALLVLLVVVVGLVDPGIAGDVGTAIQDVWHAVIDALADPVESL